MSKQLILGLGHVVLDHFFQVDAMPTADTKSVAKHGLLSGGGPVPTALVAASRLGAKALLVGQVGDDPMADFLLKEFAEAQVDTQHLRRISNQRTPMATVLVDAQGQRSVILDRADMTDLPEDCLQSLPFDEAALLLLDGKEPAALAAAEAMQEAGGDVMLDLGGPREDPFPLIQKAQIVALSRSFVMHHFPDMELFEVASTLHKMGPRLVVATLGAGGSIVCGASGRAGWFPSWSPKKIVDTTGAGDVYHGALAWAQVEGFDDAKALACAAIAGGMACEKLGGRGSMVNQERLLAALGEWAYPPLP
jgi:sulfofructose kinase